MYRGFLTPDVNIGHRSLFPPMARRFFYFLLLRCCASVVNVFMWNPHKSKGFSWPTYRCENKACHAWSTIKFERNERMHRTQKVENVSCRWSVLCTIEHREPVCVCVVTVTPKQNSPFLFPPINLTWKLRFRNFNNYDNSEGFDVTLSVYIVEASQLEAKLISAASLSVSGTQLFLFQRAEISCAVAPPPSSYNTTTIVEATRCGLVSLLCPLRNTVVLRNNNRHKTGTHRYYIRAVRSCSLIFLSSYQKPQKWT